MRRARKHWLGVVTISQSVSEFLRSPHGQTILSNSAVRLLLRRAPAGIEDVVHTFDLTEVDRATLLARGRGRGCCSSGGSGSMCRWRPVRRSIP